MFPRKEGEVQNTMPEESQRHEFSRSDATIEYKRALDNKLDQTYPEISSTHHQLLDALREREIRYASFSIRENREILDQVLTIALERAADPEDPAFSVHGDEHGTFQESIAKAVESVQGGNYNLTFQPYSSTLQTSRGRENFRFDRLILASTPYERTTYRPLALQTAYERVDTVEDEKVKQKRLRQAALDEGIPFGLLLSTYSGLAPREVFSLFSEPNFQKSLREKYGSKVKIPTPNRESDKMMITALRKAILVESPTGIHPNFDVDAYRKGLETLVNLGGWLRDEDISKDAYKMVPVRDIAQSRTVILCLNEIAQKSSDSKFLDPERTTYIDEKYGHKASTRVITSFLVIEPNPSV